MKEKGIWKAYKIFNYIKLAGLWISAVSIMGMMMFIVYDVVGRNLLFGSVRGGFEIVQNYFMPLAVFPALAYVYSSGVLPRMNLLISKTRASVQHIVVYVLLVVEIFVLSFVVYFSLNYALTGMERGMAFSAGGAMYPVYPLLFLVPIGFFLIFIENLFILYRNITEKKSSLLIKEE